MYLLDAVDGEVKWEYDAGGGFTASPAVVDGRIIIGNTDGTLYCFGHKGQTEELTTEDTESTRRGTGSSESTIVAIAVLSL